MRSHRRSAVFVVVSALIIGCGSVVVSPAAVPVTGLTELVSLNTSNAQVAAPSDSPSVDTAGDVVFATDAALDAANDTSGHTDVYLRTAGGTTILISKTSGGAAGNDASDEPVISQGGEYIAFHSGASNLIGGDGGGHDDVFLYDRDPNNDGFDGSDFSITLISTGSSGQGDANSDLPSITSASGTEYVAFHSTATNLVSGDFNGVGDVFVRGGGTTQRASVDLNGLEADGSSTNPSIASDGTNLYVAFDSLADNLVNPDDSNAVRDVFVRTIPIGGGSGTTERISVSSTGGQGDDASSDPSVSADGNLVAFRSDATNLVTGDTNALSDVFLRDRAGSTTTRESVASDGTEGNDRSDSPALSADGSFLAFRSFASNLVGGDTNGYRDVFIRNLGSPGTTRASVGPSDVQATGRSSSPAMSSDGTYLAFASDASDLVASDINGGVMDVFRRTRDIVGPGAPTATPDAGHPLPSVLYSSDRTIDMALSATDGGAIVSGIAGYSYTWNTTATGTPNETVDATGATPTTTSPSLSTGTTHYFHVRAVDNAGNWGPASDWGPFKIDATKPVLAITTTPNLLLKTTSIALHWTETDADSGPGSSYEVYYQRAKLGSNTYSTLTKKASVRTRSYTFTGMALGYTYKFVIKGADVAGNVGTSPAVREGVAASNSVFAGHGYWTSSSSSAYFGGSAKTTTTNGAQLYKSVGSVRGQVGVIVTMCSTCGKVEIFVYAPGGCSLWWCSSGATYLDKVVNTYSSSTVHKKLFVFSMGVRGPYFSVMAKLTSGQKVIVEGAGAVVQ